MEEALFEDKIFSIVPENIAKREQGNFIDHRRSARTSARPEAMHRHV